MQTSRALPHTQPRAKRERKQVERLPPAPTPEKAAFEIPTGSGTALVDIPNVAFHIGLAKNTSGGPELKTFYRLCYGKVGKVRSCCSPVLLACVPCRACRPLTVWAVRAHRKPK